MEQLAYFVTKSFEYSNTTNRVLEIIKMTTKFDDESANNKSDEQRMNEDSGNSIDEDEESVEIEITDNDVKANKKYEEEKCDKNKISDKTPITIGINENSSSPLPLIKKINRDGTKHVTKNWLISDCSSKKVSSSQLLENQENFIKNIVRVEDILAAKKHSIVRAKPVNELLKQIREISNEHNSNENLKVELEDENIKITGELFLYKSTS